MFFIELLCKVVNLVDFPTVIATASILIAVFTLLEMRQQRKESYRPRILLKKCCFWLKLNTDQVPASMFDGPSVKQKNETKSFKIELTNIGLGAAHEIKFELIYDLETVLSHFHGFENMIFNSNGFLQYKMASGNFYGIRIDNSYKDEKYISYLLSTESYELVIPDIIHNVITFLPYLNLQSGKKQQGDEIINNDFSVRLSYRDISNRKYVELNKLRIKTYLPFNSQFYGIGDISIIK